MSNTLEGFIEQYATALGDQDIAQLTACCSKPTVFVSDTDKRVCNSTKDLEYINSQIVGLLAKGKVVNAVPKVLQSMRLSDAIQFVNVKWTFYGEQQQPLFSCNCSYTLQITETGEIKIIVVVLDDENAAIQELRAITGEV